MKRTIALLLYSAALSFADGLSFKLCWLGDDKPLFLRSQMSLLQTVELLTPEQSLSGVGFGGGGGDWEPRRAGPTSDSRSEGRLVSMLPASDQSPALAFDRTLWFNPSVLSGDGRCAPVVVRKVMSAANLSPIAVPDPAPWSLVPLAIAVFTVRHRIARSLFLLLLIFGLLSPVLLPDRGGDSRILSRSAFSAN